MGSPHRDQSLVSNRQNMRSQSNGNASNSIITYTVSSIHQALIFLLKGLMVLRCSYLVGLICSQIISRISLSSMIMRGWILTNLCSCFRKTTPDVNLTENMRGNLLCSRCQFLQAKCQCEPQGTPKNPQHSFYAWLSCNFVQ